MPAKKSAEDKRTQILDALHLCLQEKPFDQTSIKDIARTAGVNHGLLHYYFRSKEDILLHYIDQVIARYKTMFIDWLSGKDSEKTAPKALIADFFNFMNDRITLNHGLSRVFVEIWEIAAYNPVVRDRLRTAYREWIGVLEQMLARTTADPETAGRIATAVVAFLEGISLFSVILDPGEFDCPDVLNGFQRRILEML